MELTEFELPFLRKEQVSSDAYAFYFDRTIHPFDFLPGQYIRIILPHENMDQRGDKRYFSIITSPLNQKEIAVTTRIIQSSFKKALFNLTPGTSVKFWGPLGRFILNEQETQPHVFLAGGIGITPFHCMITYAAEKNLTIPITFFVSFSTTEEVIFYDELKKISDQSSSIKIIYTVTKPPARLASESVAGREESKKPWSGETGRISAEMIEKYIADVSGSLFYIAGPPAMVTAMETMVKEMGLPPEQIRKENFVGY